MLGYARIAYRARKQKFVAALTQPTTTAYVETLLRHRAVEALERGVDPTAVVGPIGDFGHLFGFCGLLGLRGFEHARGMIEHGQACCAPSLQPSSVSSRTHPGVIPACIAGTHCAAHHGRSFTRDGPRGQAPG
jgi:hypothetical protein